jgi:hypothetical protein
MIITIKNPITNEDVNIEVQVSTTLSTQEDGTQTLYAHAQGFILLSDHTHDEIVE